MIFESADFVFRPPPIVSRARRVLIKPSAAYPAPYPVTTSRDILAAIIRGIRQVSDADILLLEGTAGKGSIYPIYQTLGYDFPRVLLLDVKDCIWVEVDNPLPKPLAMPTFWVPNVILSSDYLISVAPLKVTGGKGNLSIMNMLSLLPHAKYTAETPGGWEALYSLDIERVITDLYFTLPFDMGIIEARQKFTSRDNPLKGEIEEYGKVFVGEPYEIDSEASGLLGLNTDYLDLIRQAKTDLGSES